MNELIIGGTYRHYKGNLYQIICFAKDSETLKDMVVYKAMYDNKISSIWCRQLEMFDAIIEKDGKIQKRFELIQ